MSHHWQQFRKDWRENADDLRAGWRPLLLFDLLCKLLSLAIFAPLGALFLNGLLHWSGDQAISNFDLISFFLSPQGLLLIVFSATLSFAVVFFELGGLTMIVLGLKEGKRPTAVRALLFLSRNARDLWMLGLRQFLILGAIAAAVLAIAAITKATLLGGGDIYFYIQTRPPVFRLAVSIVLIAGLIGGVAGLVLLIRWILSVPLLLTTDMQPPQAMTESRRLVKSGGTWGIVSRLLLWLAGMFLIAATIGVLLQILEQVFLGIAGQRVAWVIALAALLQVIRFVVGTALGIVMVVTFAALIARLLSHFRPETSIPDTLASAGPAPERQIRIGRLIFGGAVVLVLLAASLAIGLINRIQFDHTVAVTAHRGSSIAAPENTMAAIQRALEDGSDYVEIDVQETADGVVVLIHDTDLRRLAGVSRNTWEVPLAEMKELDIGSWFSPEFANERIVTLEEAIEAVRNKAKLNIELKFNGHDKELEAAVDRIVREKKFEDDCVVMSLDYGGIRKIAAMNENLRAGLTLTARIGDPTAFDVDFLAVNANATNRDLVARAHRAGQEVHVWTVNDADQMLTMIHLGVDNIITDVPDVLVELLEERKKLSNAEKILLYIADFLEGRL